MAHIRKRVLQSGDVRWDVAIWTPRGIKTRSFSTEREAKRHANKQELHKDDTGGNLPGSRERVSDYLERWLKAHSHQVRDVTIYSYRSHLRRWVFNPPEEVTATIGDVWLERLQPATLNTLYAEMLELVSIRSVRYLHTILREGVGRRAR